MLSLVVLTQHAGEPGQQQRAKLLLALRSVQRPRLDKIVLKAEARARRSMLRAQAVREQDLV